MESFSITSFFMSDLPSRFRLDGKVAIVTGASRGLGKAMALALAEAGADVIVTDVLDCKQTVKEINALGKKGLGLKLDVTKKSAIARAVKKALAQFKHIDILINNAGIYYPTPVADLKEKDWDKIISVNLKGTLLLSQAVGAHMMKRKQGRIINIASIAGISAFAQSAAYNASKAAVIMLTKTLATEWGAYGIRVNAICPGIFQTDMTKGLMGDKSFQTMIKTRIPLRRHATPDELMGAALFLASDASSYMTGHAMVIDGGWTVGL